MLIQISGFYIFENAHIHFCSNSSFIESSRFSPLREFVVGKQWRANIVDNMFSFWLWLHLGSVNPTDPVVKLLLVNTGQFLEEIVHQIMRGKDQVTCVSTLIYLTNPRGFLTNPMWFRLLKYKYSKTFCVLTLHPNFCQILLISCPTVYSCYWKR